MSDNNTTEAPTTAPLDVEAGTLPKAEETTAPRDVRIIEKKLAFPKTTKPLERRPRTKKEMYEKRGYKVFFFDNSIEDWFAITSLWGLMTGLHFLFFYYMLCAAWTTAPSLTVPYMYFFVFCIFVLTVGVLLGGEAISRNNQREVRRMQRLEAGRLKKKP